MSHTRDIYFDMVKAVAMLMVVIWHIIYKGDGGGGGWQILF